jgi:hypothetical protein
MAHVRFRRLIMASLALLTLGCAAAETGLLDVDTGLPPRTADVDTSRLSEVAHPDGGNVFVTLTGEPTQSALQVLSEAGLESPAGHDGILVFPSLNIATVAGHVERASIRKLAILRFVTRIEWTDLGGPIFPLDLRR